MIAAEKLVPRQPQTNSLRYKFFAEILAAIYGTWRSLVARTLGVGEAPSSNLGVPTSLGLPIRFDWKPSLISRVISHGFTRMNADQIKKVITKNHLKFESPS
jgi:hypothetical protein